MTKKLYPSLSGKKIAVSGSTGGIGRELCRHIASLNGEIICLDRNAEKAARLMEEIKKDFPDTRLRHIYMDLEDLESVGAAADRLGGMNIDFLVLCAGAYHVRRRKCEGGTDNIFQINFLAPYYLATRMKPYLVKNGGRAVAVGSISQVIARFDPTDPFCENGGAAKAYGNAKRCLSFALTRSFEGSDSLAVTHPGISPTGITSGYPAFIKAVIKYPMKLVFMSPRRASECVLRGIFEPTSTGKWIGPRAFGVWGKPRTASLGGYNAAEADLAIAEGEKILKMLVGS